MTDALLQLLALPIGALVGWVFFAGLRHTVNGLERSRRPILRLGVSLMLRFGLTIGFFLLLARYSDWIGMLAATAGFVVTRSILLRRQRLPTPPAAGWSS